MNVETVAVVMLGGAFDHNELDDNDIAPCHDVIEKMQIELVKGSQEVHVELVDRAHVERLTAERDGLQQLLNARDEEADSLRADAERYRWMKANVRNGSFGTDTGWIDDDTEQWDCDIDIKRGVLIPEWQQENQA